MAKRFTDTEIWDKEWFMELSPTLKNLVQFVRSKCNFSGVWSPNYVLASLYIKGKVTEKDLLEIDDGNQFRKVGDKIIALGFIPFQYGSVLKYKSPMHRKVVDYLIDNDLLEHFDVEVDYEGIEHSKRPKQDSRKTLKIKSRDNMSCQYCGMVGEENDLQIDHFIPISLGGSNKEDNLFTACKKCNSEKYNKHPLDFFINERLDTLSKLSNRVFKILNTLKEEDKEEVKEEAKDKEKNKVKAKEEDSEKIEIVYPFNSILFIQKWKLWLEYRKENKLKYKSAKSEQMALKQLSEFDEEFAISLIENSIANGWKGLIYSNTKHEYEQRKSGVIKFGKKQQPTDADLMGEINRVFGSDKAG